MLPAGLLLALLPIQDPKPIAGPESADGGSDSGQVEALRQRIHTMRLDLLLGGDKVRKAESDATHFYQEKVELVEKRLDTLAGELTEVRAAYQLSLEHALQSGTEEQRKNALNEAREQRQKVQSLENEQTELTDRRTRLEKLVEAVQARGREREKLATKIESGPESDAMFALPLADIGLAPETGMLTPGSPLEDEGLVGDLLARDPVGAHRLLYAADPKGYWNLFPLQPPATALRTVLKLPPPDLPGQR